MKYCHFNSFKTDNLKKAYHLKSKKPFLNGIRGESIGQACAFIPTQWNGAQREVVFGRSSEVVFRRVRGA